MTDIQLQQRAGKNYPDFLLFHRLSETVKKLTTKSILVLDNPKDEALMVSSFADGVVLLNRTTSTVTAELYFEDVDGNRILIDSGSSVVGDDMHLQSPLVYLNAGEKLALEITSVPSITTGEGLWMTLSTNRPAAPNGSPEDRMHVRVTNTVFDLVKRPGLLPSFQAGYGLSVLNFSNDDLTVSVVASTPDGDVTLESAIPVPNNDITFLNQPEISSSDENTVRLVFSALPATKYLLVCEEYLITKNRVDQLLADTP